jgi:hypothetical protein
MKSTRVLFFAFLFSLSFFAQRERVAYLPTFDERPLHFGFYLGLNQNDFKLNLKDITLDTDITVEPTTGFNVGLVVDLRLHKNLNLRLEPGLVSNSKRILFNHLTTAADKPQDSIREVASTYLHIPLLFKFSTDRYKNIRPYVLGGVSYDYNFSSNEKGEDNHSSQFRTQTHNFMYEVGIGIDFYLYYFKFSPSIRGVFAINNEIKYDDPENGVSKWTDPINFVGTRGVFLNFAFE